jgi:hypothetical protein
VKYDGTYNISIRGLGFGFDDSKTHYNTHIYVNEKLLPDDQIDLTARREMKVRLLSSDVSRFFLPSKINYIPIRLHNEITTKNFFGVSSTRKYDTKFNLILMPIRAGYMILQQTLSEDVWDYSNVLHASISKPYGGCSNDNACVMSEEWPCPANAKVINVRYDRASGNPWSYRNRPPKAGTPLYPGIEYEADFDILNDSQTVHVYRRMEVPTTPIYYVDYIKKKTVYRDTTSLPLYFNFGQTFELTLDQRNTDDNYNITGKLTTGQVIDITNSTINSSQYLKFLGKRKVGPDAKVAFQVNVDN